MLLVSQGGADECQRDLPERGTSENRSQPPPSLSKEVARKDPEIQKEGWKDWEIAQLYA